MPPSVASVLRVLKNNKWLKLLALLLAVGAWYAIRDVTSFESVIKDVPLRISVPPGWAVLDRSVANVDVILRGAMQDIRFLNRDQVIVEVDLGRARETGLQTVPLGRRNVRLPGSARVLRVQPPELVVGLDRESDKQVPVRADIVGQTPDGVEVERVICTPASVVMHGPGQRLSEVPVVRTEPIDLEGRVRSFQLNKSIVLPSDSWSARVDPQYVQVEVILAERSSRRVMENVPIRALMPPRSRDAVQLTPAAVTVTVRGSEANVGQAEASRVLAFVDCSGIERGQRLSMPVRATVGGDLQVEKIEPPLVDVELAPSVLAPP